MQMETLVSTQVLQITIVSAVVWLLTRTVTKQHAHLSYVLWIVVLLKCLTPPIWSSPLGVFSWIPNRQVQSVDLPAELSNEQCESTDVTLSRFEGQEFSETGASNILVPELLDSSIETFDDELDFASTNTIGQIEHDVRELAHPVAEPSSVNGTYLWITVGWLAIAGAMLLGTLGRAVLYVRRLKAAEVDSVALESLTRQLSEKLKLRRPAKLLVTSCSVGPAVIGLFRPLIVLPKFIVDRSSVDELKPIIAHELIHVRRGDLWIGLFRHVARSLWWFHPFVWQTSSNIQRNAERCCDEEVIASLEISPNDYARALLDVLELKQVLKAVPVVPGVRPFDITSKRLERIMKLGQGSRQQTPRWCWAVALLLAVVSLPGAALIHGDERVNAELAKPVEEVQEAANNPRVLPAPPAAEISVAKAADLSPFPSEKNDEPTNITVPTVMLECLLMSANSESMDGLNVEWRTMPRSKLLPQRKEPQTVVLRSSGLQTWGESQLIVEKRFPILYALLSDEQTRDLVKQTKGMILSRPKVTVRDGEPGHIQAGAEKEFVVGIGEEQQPEKVKLETGVQAVFEPKIIDDAVQLGYSLTQSIVRSVAKVEVRTGDDTSVELQVPEIENSTITGANKIPTGKTLLVRIQSDQANADTELILAMVKPTAFLPKKVTGKSKSDPTEKTVLAPGDVLGVYIASVIGSEHKLPPVHDSDSFDVPPALGYPIPIRDDGTIPLPMIEDPKVAGLSVEEAEKLVIAAYTKGQGILPPDQVIFVTLIRKGDAVARLEKGTESRSGTSKGEAVVTEESLRGGSDHLVVEVVGPPNALVGESVDVRILIKNNSSIDAENCIVSTSLPDQIKLIESDLTPQKSASKIAWCVGKLGAGEDKEINVTIEAVNAGSLRMIAYANAKNATEVSAALTTHIGTDQIQTEAARRVTVHRFDRRRRMKLKDCIKMALENGDISHTLGVRILPVGFSIRNMQSSDLGRLRPNEFFPTKAEEAALRKRIQLTRTTDVTYIDAESNVRDYLFEVSQAYWNLRFYDRNLESSRAAVTRAHAAWKRSKSRTTSGAEAANEAEARAQYFSFKSNLKQAEAYLIQQESRLRSLLGLSAYGDLIQPIDTPEGERVEFDWEAIRAEAINSSPELRRQRRRVEQNRTNLAAARKELLSELDPVESHRILGLQGDDQRSLARSSAETDFNVESVDPFENEFGEYLTGREYQMPIGYRAEVAEIRNLQLQLARSEKKLQDLELGVIHQLKAAAANLRESFRIAQSQRKTCKAFEDQLNASRDFANKNIPIDVHLDAQARLSQSSLDFFLAVTRYQLAIDEVRYRKGSLLESYDVDLLEFQIDSPQSK